MQGLSLDNSVAAICGGACVLAGCLAVLSLVSLLGARTGDAAAERASAFALGLVAFALSLTAFWSASVGLVSLGGPLAQLGAMAHRLVEGVGLPVALFQIQASVSAVVVAVLAWRYPNR